MEPEKNKIYIPTNIQTETIIFQGYGMKELCKTLVFSLILCALWGIIYLFTHSAIQFLFEAMASVAAGVFVFVKDTTNQSMVDYIKYIIKFACTQRIYKYDNAIEKEENYLVRKYQENAVSEKNR